jgi:hypothetical protein
MSAASDSLQSIKEQRPRKVATLGSTEIFAGLVARPWTLNVQAVVVPTGPSGGLGGGFATALRENAGTEWDAINGQFLLKLKNEGVGPESPIVITGSYRFTTARYLIFATGIGPGADSRAGAAATAIITLAHELGIVSLVLPPLGSGRAKVASPELTAELTLSALRQSLGASEGSSLKMVILTTLSGRALAVMHGFAQNSGSATPDEAEVARDPHREVSRGLLPAAVAVDEYVSRLGFRMDQSGRDLITLGGQLSAERHDRDQRHLMTTSTLLFALVDRGRGRPGDRASELVAAAVIGDRPDRYLEARSEFIPGDVPREPPQEDRPTVASLTANFETVLSSAAQLQGVTGGSQIGTAALALALLRTEQGRFNDRLKRFGLDLGEVEARLADNLLKLIEEPTPSRPPGASEPLPQQSGANVRNREWMSGYRTDSPLASAEDYIDIAREVRAFAYLSASKDIYPPLSIGLFGEWGSGKTFFMERMYDQIEKIADPKEPYQATSKFHAGIVQIRFNAWHYIETNLWASLVEFIFSELDSWLSRKGKDREKIEALFEALETSKQLRLDAVRDLLASLSDRQKASKELDRARRDQETAARDSADFAFRDVWTEAASAFLAQRDDNGRTINVQIRSAAKELGLDHLSDSAGDLAHLVDDTRGQMVRVRTLAFALIARLRDPRTAAVAIGGIVAFPVAMELVRSAIPWLQAMSGGVLALASFFASSAVAGRALLERGMHALDRLDMFRAKLDEKQREATEARLREAADKERALSEARKAVEAAEHLLAAATQAVGEAEREYSSDSARGRLNRFIREKVADGTYAKHLGIVATIRRDFERLAAIMQEPLNGTIEDTEAQEVHQLYVSKLDALLKSYENDQRKLLSPDFVQRLKARQKSEDLRFFSRIVLYIDDLDRCPPDKVADVLQAIHLLLFFPLFVVIVAVDARWIARSLQAKFPHLLEEVTIPDPRKRRGRQAVRYGTSDIAARQSSQTRDGRVAPPLGSNDDLDFMRAETATAQDYLEKIFQIPFWVRRMDTVASRSFVGRLARSGAGRSGPGMRQGREEKPPREYQESEIEPGAKPALEPTDARGPEETVAADTKAHKSESATGTFGQKPPLELAPDVETLDFTANEINLLEEFAPFLGGSPRRAKRFVNLYHLLKVGMPTFQPGERVELRERALIVALAIVTGAPRSARLIFEVLQREQDTSASATGPSLPPAGERWATLEDLVHRFQAAHPDALEIDMPTVLQKLISVNARDGVSVGSDMTQALIEVAPTVRRYSFELSHAKSRPEAALAPTDRS